MPTRTRIRPSVILPSCFITLYMARLTRAAPAPRRATVARFLGHAHPCREYHLLRRVLADLLLAVRLTAPSCVRSPRPPAAVERTRRGLRQRPMRRPSPPSRHRCLVGRL